MSRSNRGGDPCNGLLRIDQWTTWLSDDLMISRVGTPVMEAWGGYSDGWYVSPPWRKCSNRGRVLGLFDALNLCCFPWRRSLIHKDVFRNGGDS
jgi:hypothetical protein